MESDHSPISSKKLIFKEVDGLSGSTKFCVFNHSTINDEEDIPMGDSRPWRSIHRTIHELELYQEIYRSQSFVQPTEIDRHIDGKSILII